MEQQGNNILDGKYEIIKRLASGGMSDVYLVRHLHLEEQRVIKVLRPESASDPTAQARFLRAARMATQIKHPNVAILYDSARLTDGSFYMVWEYIDGEDVGHWVERRGAFPLEAAIDLGIQALRGLEAIHSYGIIHRDISPDNLMLARDVRNRVRLKIIDLGLAKNLKPDGSDLEVTQAGVFMGKLRYCSPEQAGMVEGAVLDRRTDLYSFAAVFYEMLCGQPPFESETPHGFVFKRLTEEPLPLVGRVPGIEIPRRLEQVVQKGLERERERRFATAVEFIEALESVRNSMMQLTTREMPRIQVPAAAPSPAPPHPATPTERSSSQLSREEKDDLLAQINEAAKRVEKTRGLMEKATRALSLGNLDAARELLARIEVIDPKAKGLTALREGLAQARQESEDPLRRREDTESMLEKYLSKKQVPLARLALETLLEIIPDHPRRGEYEERIAALAATAGQEQEAAEILDHAREALLQGDIDLAAEDLAALRQSDLTGKLAEAFAAELDEARQDERATSQLTARKQRFEELLQAGDLDAAQRELEGLASLRLTRVTLDVYRSQLEDARRVASQQGEAQAFEARYREHLAAGDWLGAREVALEMEAALRGHPRPPQLFTELERLRQAQERHQALEQGARQVEELIAAGQGAQAAMALKILLKMDPRHPKRAQLEKKIATLRG